MIKKPFFVAILFFALVVAACQKVDDLLTFYIEEEESIKVESHFPIGALIPLTPVTVTTNSEETFKNNKTRAELVKDVTLNRLTLSIAEPATENFDFLKKIEIYTSSEGKDEVKIAYLDEVPAKPVSEDITIKADTRFKVTADPK